MFRSFCRAALLLAFLSLLASCTPAEPSAETPVPSTNTPPVAGTSVPAPTATTPAWVPPEHPIQVRTGPDGAEFYNTNTSETFIPRGVNHINLVWTGSHYEDRLLAIGIWDPEKFRADLQALAARGYDTVRIFIDSCNGGSICMANPSGAGLNDGYLDNMADMMQIAKEEGLFLQLTSNDIPDGGGYGELANRETSDRMGGYRNAHMLTGSGHEAAHRYWEDLMLGLIEREAPLDAVLGWQLLNEQWLFGDMPPLSFSEGIVASTVTGESYDMADPAQKRDMIADSLMRYISTMAETIKTYDPSALITMGFFSPQFPNPSEIGGSWYVDTASLIERGAQLDYYDFHAYAGSDITFQQIVENFSMVGYGSKPVVLGEYGVFHHQYDSIEAAARILAQTMTEACLAGFDGMLLWTYKPTPRAVGDSTWALTDEDNFLFDLFAPDAWPDPCIPIEVPTDNLALGAIVFASQSPLPGEEAFKAVDGDTATQWGSGSDPLQWIEIDLGEPHTVEQIRLLVAQWPEGETTHRVRVAGPDRAYTTFTEFAGPTEDGDWLEYTPDTPLTGIQFVLVETLRSPSWVAWKEIEVIGQ